MERKESDKHTLVSIFIITVLLVGTFEIFWLIRYGNTPQVYTDIVLEELGSEFANKTIEFQLYWIGIFLGIAIITLLLYWGRQKKHILAFEDAGIKWSDSKLVIAGITTLFLGSYLFYGYFSEVVVLSEVVILISLLYSKDYVLETITCYFISIYSITAGYRIGVFVGMGEIMNQTFASIIAFIFSMIMLKAGKDRIYRAILVLQLLIPGLFLIYLINDYEYMGTIISIKPEKSVYLLIFFCIIIAFASALITLIKNWNVGILADCISMWSIVAIMVFQRFSGSGYIMLNDMHHPAENTIAFNEITNLGRAAFKEYVPVSGLYSYVQGLFLEIFGKGNYTAYSVANNVFYLVIIILLVIGIRQHLNSLLTLFFGIFIYVSDYSRVALIIPFMLILLSGKLISKPNFWMPIWIVFAWMYVLYYPAYGVAIIISLIPLGCYQLKACIEELRDESYRMKTLHVAIYVGLMTAIIISFPLLMGTLQHVIAMGDGMIYVDGVTIFGQPLPTNFLVYLKSDTILYSVRIMLGYIIRFSVPMITVWIAYCAVLCVFKHKDGRNWRNVLFKLDVGETSILAALIFPLVCFYFSLYRMGPRNMFNRAVYIIDFSLIIVAIILYKYGKDNLSKYWLLLIAFFICTTGNSIGIGGLAGKYYKNYNVSEDYVYTQSREDIPRLGTGFVQQDLMEGIENAASKYNEMDKGRNYFALFANGDHGMAYDAILNIRGTAMLESLVIRGYGISQDTADKLVASNTIVGNCISPVDHYYLYKWLCTGGKYIWSEKDQLFYPVENESEEDIRNANARVIASMPTYNAGRYAASLGNSIENMDGVLNLKDITCSFDNFNDGLTVKFEKPVDGNQIDYIYLDIDMGEEYNAFILGTDHVATNSLDEKLMKHDYNPGIYVVVEWQDDFGETHSISALVENGKVLMPVGAGVRWLNNSHSFLNIWIEKDGTRQTIPPINQLEFYTVRDLIIK